MPETIMIIRHAEKPTAKGEAPSGVTADGDQDFEALTVRGWQRAGGLVSLFAPTAGRPAALATPEAIYASRPKAPHEHGPEEGSKSLRPWQTIVPLAACLGPKLVPDGQPNLNFAKGEEKELAEDVLKNPAKAVLICWQHESIDAIVENLVKGHEVKGKIPTDWPGDRFDIVFVFSLPPGGGAWTFQQVPQRLLAGDSPSVIA